MAFPHHVSDLTEYHSLERLYSLIILLFTIDIALVMERFTLYHTSKQDTGLKRQIKPMKSLPLGEYSCIMDQLKNSVLMSFVVHNIPNFKINSQSVNSHLGYLEF